MFSWIRSQTNRSGPNARNRSDDKHRRWLRAVKRNDVDTVKFLLNADNLVDAQDKSGNSALIIASRYGYSSIVKLLIEHNAKLDLQNRKGQTALHLAARQGHVELAATLLGRGADFRKEDAKGTTPFGTSRIKVETLHSIRQHYHRAPWPTWADRRPQSAEGARILAELRKKGIVKLSGFIQQHELKQLVADFNQFVKSVQRQAEQGDGLFTSYDSEEHWRPNEEIYVSNNPFKYSAQLAKLCCREFVCDLANCYFGKPAFLQRGVAMRYLPREEMHKLQFGWHHDMEEKRFKMMILLSDVGENGQRMSYVNGTHKILHPYERFLKNTLDFEYCQKHVEQAEITDTIGSAGDVFFFDSNGMHRGNRTLAATRDAVFVEYTSDTSNIWGCDIPNEFLKPNALGISPFQRMAEVKEKKWEMKTKRKTTTWALRLPQVESWIVPQTERELATDESLLKRAG